MAHATETDNPSMTKLGTCGDFTFRRRNLEEFDRICQDVFAGDEYIFTARRPDPFIIDAGAHVGVATHYFKRRYPRARILALEANPVTFALLNENVAANRLNGVEARHAALSPRPGTIDFYTAPNDDAPGAWGDSAIPQLWHEEDEASVVKVPAVTLSSLLTEPVDLLKLDIEGLETEVIAEAASRLKLVGEIILEFHGTRSNPANDVARLARILRRAGLTPEIRQFGGVVSLKGIQQDDPFWLMVRGERLNPWRKFRRAIGRA
jgi:FkbM family methyltransferase